jgi:NAD(P)-dependent dehydrogenase (short-subunit alcohol dehydrogenase family)
VSPLAPLGIEAALKAKEDPSIVPHPKIFDEFALTDRVGLVSGGNRGLGLEAAIALAEAGARVVYCFDLPEEPSEVFKASREYVSKLGNGSRLEYFSADVRNQELLWKKAEEIGDKEQRFDFCVAAAGILKAETECLEYPAQEFREVSGHNRIGDTTDLWWRRWWM